MKISMMLVINHTYNLGIQTVRDLSAIGDTTEGVSSMAVPSMSTKPRTSALRMPSTHPAIRNANHM